MIKKILSSHSSNISYFLWRSLQILGKQGLSFVIFMFGARYLSLENFGLYNYMLSSMFFLVMFCDFGVSTSVARFVSHYLVIDKSKISAVLYGAIVSLFAFVGITLLCVILFGHQYFGENFRYILCTLPLLFLAPFSSILDGYYRGAKLFKMLAYISVFSGIFSLPFIVYLFKNYGLYGALLSQVFFYLVLSLASVTCVIKLKPVLDMLILKEVLRYAGYYGIAVLGAYFFLRVDVMILGHFNKIEEIAIYEFLNKIFSLIILPFGILGQVLAPSFARFFAEKSYSKILSKYKKYIIYFSSVAGVFFFTNLYLFPIVVQTYFSKFFNNIFSEFFLPTLLIYSLMVFTATITSSIMVSTGFAEDMAYINVFAGFMNFGLALFLYHQMGPVGVIYATLVSSLCVTIYSYFRFYNKISNYENK